MIFSPRPNYVLYLQSDAWKRISEEVRKRARGRCEKCRQNPIEDIHHLTYVRLGCERLEDLRALCRLCHQASHGIDTPSLRRHQERLVQRLYR